MTIGCADVCDAVIEVLERVGISLPKTDDYGSEEHQLLIDALYWANISFDPDIAIEFNERARQIELVDC